jgi:ABC-2 type transport system ATP-binding protein
MKDAISIKGLKKTYDGGKQALKGVDFTVPDGDFFALLGPNGAGKSTLIGISCGLVNKTSGSVAIQGYDIDKDEDTAKVHVGLVPQEFNFSIFETVEDILFTQAGYYGISRKEVAPQIDMLLKKLGLEEKRKVKSMTLSGGMKRRLMIARALVHKPTLLFLDEPTAGVDVELRLEMYEFLRELNKSGVTIILTTHYLEEAEKLCKHIAIMSNGEVKKTGTLESVMNGRPLEEVYLEATKTVASD